MKRNGYGESDARNRVQREGTVSEGWILGGEGMGRLGKEEREERQMDGMGWEN